MPTYTEIAADMIGLDIDPEYRSEVAKQFAITESIALPLMDFPLADDAEVAGVFKP